MWPNPKETLMKKFIFLIGGWKEFKQRRDIGWYQTKRGYLVFLGGVKWGDWSDVTGVFREYKMRRLAINGLNNF